MSAEVSYDPDKKLIDQGGRNYSPKKAYSLCGIAVDEDGTLSRSKLFGFLKLDPEEYGDIMLDAEDALRIHKRLLGVKSGGAAAKVPLICGGEEICPFADQCPFVEIYKSSGKAIVPIGRPCPIERELIAYWASKYVEEFEIELDNQSELSMVTELAELDIYDYRCTIILSDPGNADLTQQIVVGVDANGNPIYNDDVHKAWELKERVKKRKHIILEALVGTRKEKYKRDAALKKRSEEDPSTQAADLKKRLDEARRKAADNARPVNPSEEILDVEPEKEI